MTIELVLPTFNYATGTVIGVVLAVVVVVVVAITFAIVVVVVFVVVCMCDSSTCFVHLQLWTK